MAPNRSLSKCSSVVEWMHWSIHAVEYYTAIRMSKYKQYNHMVQYCWVCWAWCWIRSILYKSLWPPHAKSWLIGKDSDAGRDCGQEEKGTTEDEMTGWHHWLDGRESEWTPGVGDGQGGLACCDSWGRKESDTTEWLNWTELIRVYPYCCCCSVTKLCPALCDPTDCSTLSFPVLH